MKGIFGFIQKSKDDVKATQQFCVELVEDNQRLSVDYSSHYAIALNGSIYNNVELIKELRTLGCAFQSQSDKEIILNGYQVWGENVLHKLNGAFTIVIYNQEEQTLFVARDRFGVKPLYYYQDSDKFVFASNITTIVESLPSKPQIDESVIFDYLVFNRTDQTERTFFKDIKKLQHGNCMHINIAQDMLQIHVEKWYDLAKEIKKQPNVDEPKQHFMDLFVDAIKLRIRGEEPWGVCLSGGLDSSAIASTIVNVMHEHDVHSYSAVYSKESQADESKYIEYFNGIVPNMHYVHPNADELLNNLDNYVRTQGEPTPTVSPYALYCVMNEAKKNVNVLLDGQGSDEMLAGYEYIPGLYYKTLFTHFRWVTFIKEMIAYWRVHHSTRSIKYFLFFMLPAKLRTKARVQQRGYVNPNFVAKYQNSVIADKLYGAQTMTEMLINHFEYKLEHLTKWAYRNAVAHEMDDRSPFLDYRLVEYCLSMPDSCKVKDGYTKYMLREVMRGIMPEPVRTRVDKKGFTVPQDEWFRSEKFQKLVMGIIQSESFAKRGYIVPKQAIALYKRHLTGEINISKDIWKWINLELWFRIFID